MAEKTEKATPKKLRDSRKKGEVAKSQDFPSAFTFIVSIAATLIVSGFLFDQMAGYFVATFRMISKNIDMQNRAGGFFSQSLMIILNTSLPILMVTVFVGMLINFLIVGPLFSTEVLKFQPKRLNPVSNLKNMFKFKTLFELLKSIFKITGAIIIIYYVVSDSIPEIVSTAALPVLGSALVINNFLLKVIIRVGIFFLVVAVFDLAYQKKNFAKQMMMDKFEVKQEFKDTEGDPHQKSRRKQVAQEIAYQEGPTAVKRAKAVITNPIHIAVAVEFESEKEPAPKIVTMGKGVMADLIIKAALEYHIPIMRNVPLAHILYEKGKISDYIPEETYQAVAEILRWLEGIEAGGEFNVELFK